MAMLIRRYTGESSLFQDDATYEILLLCYVCGGPIEDEMANLVWEDSGPDEAAEFQLVHKAHDPRGYPMSSEMKPFMAGLARRFLTAPELLDLANLAVE